MRSVFIIVLYLFIPFVVSAKEKSSFGGFLDTFLEKFKHEESTSIKSAEIEKGILKDEISHDSQKYKNAEEDVSVEQTSGICGKCEEKVADLAERLIPSVVSISAVKKPETKGIGSTQDPKEFEDLLEKFFPNLFEGQPRDRPKPQNETVFGSGFVVDERGFIATNFHVVKGCSDIHVQFGADRSLPAKLIGSDELTDLAVLKIEPAGKKIVSAKFDEKCNLPKIGSSVLAIGNPYGIGRSVSAGIVSATGREINAGPYDNFIQTDAAINRGHSGGPLFNSAGYVIGINTAIISPSGGNIGIGFAIPCSTAAPIIDKLIKGESIMRGYLGVVIQNFSEQAANSLKLNEPGVLVVDISPGSPAERATEGGLKIGDVILKLNKEVMDTQSKLSRAVAVVSPGQEIELEIYRRGKKLTLKAKIEEKPSVPIKVSSGSEEGVTSSKEDSLLGAREKCPECQYFGFVASDFDESFSLESEGGFGQNTQKTPLRACLKELNRREGGTVVILEAPKSLGGLRPGDVIYSVDQETIKNINDLNSILSKIKDGEEHMFIIKKFDERAPSMGDGSCASLNIPFYLSKKKVESNVEKK